MSKDEIIAEIAKDEVVEEMVLNVARSPRLTYDLKDCVQLVYLSLLQKDEAVIQNLYEKKHDLRYYIAKIVIRQLHGHRSTYKREIVDFARRMLPLEEVPDE